MARFVIVGVIEALGWWRRVTARGATAILTDGFEQLFAAKVRDASGSALRSSGVALSRLRHALLLPALAEFSFRRATSDLF